MSVWGKLGGGAAGLIVGGPLGAALGALAGHFLVDRLPADPELTFTIAMIALSAKMAKSDGVVSTAEIEAFDRVFRVPEEDHDAVHRFFDFARRDTAGFEAYAGQIARLYAGRPAVLEDVLDGLFEIAKADGVLHPGEETFLRRVAEIFGFAPCEFRRIRASHFGPDAADPYAVLGVACDASDEEVRRTYLMLVRENHPDKLIARGVPAEFVKLATDKLSAINGAYEKILDERAAQGRPAKQNGGNHA
jgi:DnaJ like chaperone protein